MKNSIKFTFIFILSFYVKTTLTVNSLNNTQSFMCNECKKTFNKKSNLIRHKRIHTQDRRFQCLICLKKFQEKHHLNNHLKRHSNSNKLNNIDNKGLLALSMIAEIHQDGINKSDLKDPDWLPGNTNS